MEEVLLQSGYRRNSVKDKYNCYKHSAFFFLFLLGYNEVLHNCLKHNGNAHFMMISFQKSELVKLYCHSWSQLKSITYLIISIRILDQDSNHRHKVYVPSGLYRSRTRPTLDKQVDFTLLRTKTWVTGPKQSDWHSSTLCLEGWPWWQFSQLLLLLIFLCVLTCNHWCYHGMITTTWWEAISTVRVSFSNDLSFTFDYLVMAGYC